MSFTLAFQLSNCCWSSNFAFISDYLRKLEQAQRWLSLSTA